MRCQAVSMEFDKIRWPLLYINFVDFAISILYIARSFVGLYITTVAEVVFTQSALIKV